VLLSTAYFPPVAWFALLARDMTLSPDRVSPSTVFLEACETYRKQSFRNRCCILAGDGVQMLQIPVVHAGSMRIAEVRVDWSTPWLVRTQRALDAAYYTSAYYEYYRDELFEVMSLRPALLWDWNLSLIKFLLDKTGVVCHLVPTSSFVAPAAAGPDDYRSVIHPKRPSDVLASLGLERPYYQVFADRFGFTPGLSVLDLLFNEGPDAILWLKRGPLAIG
jgi:hypothetical protein